LRINDAGDLWQLSAFPTPLRRLNDRCDSGGGLSQLAEFVRVDFFEFFSRGDDGDDTASGDEVKVLMGADWGGHALTV